MCLELRDDPFVSPELVDESAARPMEIGNGLDGFVRKLPDGRPNYADPPMCPPIWPACAPDLPLSGRQLPPDPR